MKDNTIKLADVIFGEENRSFFDFLKYCFYGIFIYLNIQIELMTILAGLTKIADGYHLDYAGMKGACVAFLNSL